jgi:hypothetical protein
MMEAVPESSTSLVVPSRTTMPAASFKSLNSKNPYNFSFMGCSLRPELVRTVANYYRDARCDWALTKTRILADNALQCRTPRSALRMEREIRQRLTTLTTPQLNLLGTANGDEITSLAWLSVLKHSTFIFEFASEVLRDKLSTGDMILRRSDYEGFLEHKSVLHPELARLSSSSKIKVRQILLRMLTEAGIRSEGSAEGTIHRPAISPAVFGVIASDSPEWFAGFLLPQREIGGPNV